MLYSNQQQQQQHASSGRSISKLTEEILRDAAASHGHHLSLASHPLKPATHVQQQHQLQTPANYATLQPPHYQPISSKNSNNNNTATTTTTMHFSQQPISSGTMHFQPHQAASNTMHHQFHPQHHSPSSQTMHFPHHLNNHNNLNNHHTNNLGAATNQQQQQQQQQYNMNSDYSSSTYHIYDQISDLIIVKQQRLERKRELDRRRKVIFIAFGATILVGLLLLLILQSLSSAANSSSNSNSAASLANYNTNQLLQRDQPADMMILQRDTYEQQQSPPAGRLPIGADANLSNNRQQQQQVILTPQSPSTPLIRQDVVCSNHGQLVSVISPFETVSYSSSSSPSNLQQQQQQTQCKCEPGYWGERCEYSSATYQQLNEPAAQVIITRCHMQTNGCSGHGQCNSLGRCHCHPGYAGSECQFRALPVTQPIGAELSAAIKPSSAVIDLTAAAATTTSRTGGVAPSCPDNCSGHGQCLLPMGRCRCYAGYLGDSCQVRDLCHEQSCSKQGLCDPLTGMCQCKFGFTGLQCETRDDLAWRRLANCSQHGKFDYKLDKCVCDQGFGGFDCSEERCDPDQVEALDCGPNGLFDCRQGKCLCQDGYSGAQCQVPQCSAQCLRNGQCGQSGQCVCQPGYYGKHCSLNGCPNQCSGRGQCVRVPEAVAANQQQQQQQQHQLQAEWKCQCQAGAVGDDCGLLVERQCDDGIDNDRDGLVDCADSECCGDRVCQNSTLCMKSPDPLDILMRKQPPPPTSSFFQRMQFLIEKASSQMYSNLKDFNDSRASVIRGKVTYLKQGVTGVRVSVAGQLNLGMTLTRDGGYFDLMVNGGGAVLIEFRREPFATHKKAVRVPWNEIVLMDSIELALDSPMQLNNDDPANLQVSSGVQNNHQATDSVPSCLAHNYRLMRPVIVASPRSSRRSHSSSRLRSQQQSSRAVILRDSGMVQQSIVLPASSATSPTQQPTSSAATDESNQSVSLVYISSRANEFMSTISLQLTPPISAQTTTSTDFKLPQELKLIHVKIVIEGNLFEQIFEPQANLSFTYAWNRRNVYRQKSFGLSTASVSVGYEYFDCQHTIWTSKNIQLAGHDLSISDIGNQWNLNIHHRYNYRDSILQRGDGQNFNLKTDKPRVVQPIMGDGYQRQAMCSYCDGASAPLTEQRLLKPQALVAAPDGSLIVGDGNLIRRIERSQPRVVRTLLELPASRAAAAAAAGTSRYSLALSPIADSNKLYMSDADRYQIYLIKEQESGKSSGGQFSSSTDSINETSSSSAGAVNSPGDNNLIVVAGTGAKCGEQAEDLRQNCGDGQAAQAAKLMEPKAMTFDLTNRMYIADGPNVRMIDTDNRIYTILGDYGATRHTKFPCSPGEAIPMHKFVPHNPIDLAMSPIDDTLHVLDDNVVYKITKDKRVQIVAGRLAHCLSQPQAAAGGSSKQQAAAAKATEVFLQSPQSITFNQNGDLFISEDDQRQMISRVLLVIPDEDKISLYAGLPVDQAAAAGGKQLQASSGSQQQQQPTVDSIHLASGGTGESDLELEKQRSSNALPTSQQATKATDYKFNSVAAIAVDQQGNLIVADRVQLRILSVEPDLPQLNSAAEYEIQSPDNGDELLVFNRHGHHVATRDISSGHVAHSRAASSNKYTFYYNVNTALGQLASISYATGNKISIYRDGPHHMVKMIETTFGGQCKLDITRHGQVHSITVLAPNAGKTNFSYHVDGGLLKQSRDQATGELFDFSYDEFGRANGIQHSSPKLPAPIDCRTVSELQTGSSSGSLNFMQQQLRSAGKSNNYIDQLCSQLIVAE